jgi:hypothetical protein
MRVNFPFPPDQQTPPPPLLAALLLCWNSLFLYLDIAYFRILPKATTPSINLAENYLRGNDRWS